MGPLDGGARQQHAEALRLRLAQIRRDANVTLAAPGRQRDPARAGFHYTDPAAPHAAPRTLPVALFHRQYTLCLETLEMTVQGYCVQRQFGWERRTEAVLRVGGPPFWRRVWRPPVLLALQVRAGPDGTCVSIAPARSGARARPARTLVRLDPALQQAALQLERDGVLARADTRARRWKRRLAAWLPAWLTRSGRR